MRIGQGRMEQDTPGNPGHVDIDWYTQWCKQASLALGEENG